VPEVVGLRAFGGLGKYVAELRGQTPCFRESGIRAAEFLFDMRRPSVRPPISPTHLENLVDREVDTLSKTDWK